MVNKKGDKKEPNKKIKLPEEQEEKTFEEKKREAYAAMGRLGGQARAKQLAEHGFVSNKNSFPKNSKNENKK